MATVTSNLTRINDAEGALTLVSVGGGAGGAANTDIFIQGAQSAGRRQSNVALNGFLINDGAANDLSAASVHVGVWLWVTHYGNLTALRFRMASASASTDYDEHIVPLTEYPSLGGWIRVWIDISRTPDATGGSALNEASVQYFGPIISLPAVGGNAANLIMDAIDHTTTGLTLTGTSGVFNDFLTADEGNTTNKYGVVTSRSGIIYCQARLTFGTATSLSFSDSNFTLVFPQQNLVESTFMGLTIDLQNASTSVTMTNGTVSSPGTKKGDLIVTGTSGTFTATGMNFSGLRAVTLTSASTMSGCNFNGCGLITAAGADMTGCKISASSNTPALLWNVNTDPKTKLDQCTFISAGTGHAIELGSNTPTTIDFDNITFTGYGGTPGSNSTASSGSTDAAVYNNSGKTITININGGTSPAVRNGAGATTVIVAGAVTAAVNVKSATTGSNIQNARVFVQTDTGGSLPYNASVTITRSGSTATVSHTSHGLETNDKVVIKGATQQEYNGVYTITRIDANSYSYTVSGTPATPATGTILSSFVLIHGLTDASGNISMTRTFPADQPIRGNIRKSTASTFYKSSTLVGTVDNSTGFSTTIQLIPDE